MASRKQEKERLRAERLRREAADRERAERARRLKRHVSAVVGAAVLGLGVLFALNASGGGSASTQAKNGGGAGEFVFAVGNPGPGEKAPPIRLPSTSGGTVDLADLRGQRVLLYFQEGIMCQPCWDQIVDLEKQPQKLKALGIDTMVSITTDPLDHLEQKVADQGISTPVLSDPDLSVSVAWETNQYGMMGTSHNGHSFIVVGPDGTIEHRADYGGEPNYTMYVPVENLVADLRKGLRES